MQNSRNKLLHSPWIICWRITFVDCSGKYYNLRRVKNEQFTLSVRNLIIFMGHLILLVKFMRLCDGYLLNEGMIRNVGEENFPASLHLEAQEGCGG
jgi:hypothetical protein